MEASLLTGMLEQSGIPVFVKDEFTILLNPLYSNAVGGVKVQVLVEDLTSAMQVLKDYEMGNDPN